MYIIDINSPGKNFTTVYCPTLNTIMLSIKSKDCKEPKIELKIIENASSTNNRKIREARTILNNTPDLNDRDEQIELKRFLVCDQPIVE